MRVCRYRRWKLGEDIDLIVRCEHDGVMTGANGELSFINVKALNEWDSRVRMRKMASFYLSTPHSLNVNVYTTCEKFTHTFFFSTF